MKNRVEEAVEEEALDDNSEGAVAQPLLKVKGKRDRPRLS